MKVCLYLVLVGIIWNTLYWLWLLWSIRKVPRTTPVAQQEDTVSIVIVSRNAAALLNNNFKAWWNQKKVEKSIVLVDDGSVDHSWEVMTTLATKDHVRAFSYTKENPGKKGALRFALRQCHTPWALLTDADSVPSSAIWAAKAVQAIKDQEKEILLMYAPFYNGKGWLDRISRFENSTTAFQYYAWWTAGHPYMAVGRNVLYHRHIYTQFEPSQPQLASGDDDLFVQSVSTAQNTGALLDPDTFTYSPGPKTWWEWLAQKSRHISTAYHYKWSFQLVLFLFAATQVLMGLSTVYLLLHPSWLWSAVLIRWTIFMTMGKKSLQLLRQENLYPYLVLLDIMLALYLLIVWPFSLLSKSRSW